MPASQALQPHRHPYQFSIGIALLLLALPMLWLLPTLAPPGPLAVTLLGYWQTASRLVVVVVAVLIFITGYRAILSPRKGAVVWLGVVFLGVGALDLLHLIADAGPSADRAGTTAAAALWFSLGGRLLAATALLVYAALPAVPDVDQSRKRLAVAIVLALVGASGYVGLFQAELMPSLYTAQGDLTGSTMIAHGAGVALNLLSLGVFWQRRADLERECLMALVFAAALSAVADLCFIEPSPLSHDGHYALGHFYQVAAYLYLFHATFNEALRRPLERLDMMNQRERATLNAAPDGVLWVNSHGNIVLANPAIETLSGYSPGELTGQNIDIFLPPHLRERHAQSMREYFTSPSTRPMGMMDLKLYRRDGTLQPVDISLAHCELDGEMHAIAYLRDLTERKKLEESLRHQATHDDLTGLPNRWLFHLQLKQALVRSERAERRVAVLFIDLDHFKTVNDTFGHSAGDALLMQASRRIHGLLRASDTLARLGGDEFAVLLPDVNEADEAVTVAVKILACMQEAFELTHQQVYSGASVGLAYYPDDARDSDSLLRFADMAMYPAKQQGRGAYACYSRELDQRTHEDMRLHARLKAALHDRLLTLHFQPQVELGSGRLLGAEALLRWQDPVLGTVMPDRFIPIAEATGLILPLADWVLENACERIAAWQRAGTPIRLAVNISAQQLHQGQLAEKVRDLLQRTGAQAHWLELEITETMAMTQPRRALAQLKALVDLGCSVSLDDFGTGYSSLSYLKILPVRKIKIDRSFVQDITDDPNDDVIVQTIIGMARNLGLDVLAEGVETEAQRDRLSLYGCNSCQGYLFHRPMPLEEFEVLLRRNTPSRNQTTPQEERA
jgi:diguanylate cyclase (GGDEF)-like protein/PAS domain S-box-containing protein